MPLPLIPIVLGGISIAGTAFGAKKGYDAYNDISDAKKYNQEAQKIYDKSQEELDKSRQNTNQVITNFGLLKEKIFENEVMKFVDIFSKIKNFNEKDINIDFYEKIDTKNDMQFDKLKDEIFTMKNMLGGTAASLSAGTAAGFGVFGMTGALASASTGTAISTLSGVAASNATLAWLGGGSLATGGLGMTGGMVVLGGVVTGPALAVAGWALSAKAETAKNEAHVNLDKARSIKNTNDTVILKLSSIDKLIEVLSDTIKKLNDNYLKPLNEKLEYLVSHNNDYEKFSQNEKELAHITLNVAMSIKNLISIAVLNENGEITDEIRATKLKAVKLLNKISEIDKKFS